MLKKKQDLLQPVRARATVIASSGGRFLTDLDEASPFGTRRARWWERLIWRLTDARVFSRRLRQRLRKKFARPITGPFDVTFEKMKFRLYPAENYCDRILFGRHQLPEKEEHESLTPFITPGMTFVDVGANVGSYSVFVGEKCGGDVRLLAFEPHPRTYRKLLYNLQANGLVTQDVINCGVGSRSETLKLWSDGGSNIGHTSMLPEGTSKAKVSVDVPVTTLLETCSERNIRAIDLLKIDIEGFEDRAISPFLDKAEKHMLPKAILIEIAHQHLWETDLLKQFDELGYKIVSRTKENLLFQLS